MLETPGAGLRGYNGTVWGTIQAVDDSKTMQRVDIRGLNGEMILGVERPQNYGETSVPLPPEREKAAEVVVGFKGGDRAHPYVHATDDRRYRMKNLKPGERANHDDQGQYSKIARDRHERVAKMHTMTAGDKPDTGDHELQEQLKGLDARLSQAERHIHGQFDVTSRLNMIAMTVIPGLKVLAPILNQDPSGLDQMEAAILGKAPAYLQKQISQALGKFGNSPMAAVASVLGGGIEGLIAAATAQITKLMQANPAVAQVDALVDELASLQGSASPAVVAEMQPILQGLIDAATKGNPAVAEVADLRSKLAGLVASAGPGLGFLAPQQRMAQGLTKSLKLMQ